MMENTAANTLRNRAAAAFSRRKLEERLKRREIEGERLERARRLIWEAIGISTDQVELPFEIDGLLFDCSQYPDAWLLNLLQPCIECSQLYSTALNDLADLGELLEEGPSLCARCDC